MFEQFYGLTANPFQLTPDPRFYFESLTHRKALSYLGYGLAQGLVLQWAQDQRGWVALVVFVLEQVRGGDVTVQEWLPADRLRPASA